MGAETSVAAPNLKPPTDKGSDSAGCDAVEPNLKLLKVDSVLLAAESASLKPPPLPKLKVGVASFSASLFVDAVGVLALALGLGVSQATHLVLSAGFEIMQTSQDHFDESAPFIMNLAINGSAAAAGDGCDTDFLGDPLTAAPPPPGLGVSQATHFTMSALLLIMQTSQDQPDFFMNFAIKSSGFDTSSFFSALAPLDSTTSSFFSSALGLPKKLNASSALLLLEVKPPNLKHNFSKSILRLHCVRRPGPQTRQRCSSSDPL